MNWGNMQGTILLLIKRFLPQSPGNELKTILSKQNTFLLLTLLLDSNPFIQCGYNDQGQQSRRNKSSYDDNSQWLLNFCTSLSSYNKR